MSSKLLRTRLAIPACAAVLAGAAPCALSAQMPALGVDTANFDHAVRPQDDFFRYVNGTWLKTHKLPEDRSNYGTFTELADRSDDALRTLIEAAAAASNRPAGTDAQKVGDFYASFMDTVRIEQIGMTPLRPELARISAVTGKAALPALFAHLGKIGVQTPFAMYISQDDKHADQYIAAVYQSGIGLPDRDYYSNEGPKFAEARAGYRQYIETLLRMTGQPDPAAAARNIMALEDSLAAAQWDRVKNRDPEATYNRYTVAQLDAMTPAFSWSGYAAAAGIEQSPAVLVRQPSFVQAVDRAIGRVPTATWKQYLTFKLLDAYAGEMGRRWQDASFAFNGRVLQGLTQPLPRWKRGVGAVEGTMGMLSGRLYVEQNFKPEAKASMEQLVGNLLGAFRQSIDSLEWMSPATRAQAQNKLAHITVKIGYPEKWTDYAKLEIRPGDLVGNTMRASAFEYDRNIAKLGQPIDRTEWGMTPQTVNAYYNPPMNEIVFPAAILQPPFFDPNADDATNYGAIGAVIGHEISHGFDDQGRQYDATGNLHDWWTADDATAFQGRADRLAGQYGEFSPLEGMKINGKMTLGENIGDVSGLAVAYRAYKMSLNGREAPVIDGFTGDQRFFLGWAQVWRRMYRDANLRQRLLTDPHSPSEFRVNGVLRNMPAFYAAFGVKAGDKMYVPEVERVKIW